MIPGKIRSKIPLEMTLAYHSSYLNEMSSIVRLIHFVQSHDLRFCGQWRDAVTLLPLLKIVFSPSNSRQTQTVQIIPLFPLSFAKNNYHIFSQDPFMFQVITCSRPYVFDYVHLPGLFGAVLKWLVRYFLWCLPALWPSEFLYRT